MAYNIAANQILPQPVTSFYEGKAMRLGLKMAEKELEYFDDEQERADRQVAVNERNVALRESELLMAVAEWEDEAGKARMIEQAGAMIALGEEARASDDPISYANERLPGIIENIPDGPTKQYLLERAQDDFSKEELVGIEAIARAAVKKYPEMKASQQADFLAPDENGDLVAIQGSFDPVTRTYYDSDGNPVTGAQPIAPQATQGDLPSAGGDKVMARQVREIMGATDNLLDGMDRIDEIVDKAPQASLGLPGNIAGFVDQSINAVQGLAELTGGWAEVNGQKVSESTLLDLRLYADIFEDASITDAALQANAIGIAYSLARAANPDGRISDADVRHQLDRLQLGQSSKSRIKSAIGEVRRETLRSAMNWLRTSGATKTKDGQDAFGKYERALNKMNKEPEQEGKIPKISSEKEYDDLPSGAMFRDPNGKLRQKP